MTQSVTNSPIGLAPIAKNYWIFRQSTSLVALENHVFTEITQCTHSQDTWGPWPVKCDSKMYNERNLSTQARLVGWTTWLSGCWARGLTSDNRLMGDGGEGGLRWKTRPLWLQRIDIINTIYTFIKDIASLASHSFPSMCLFWIGTPCIATFQKRTSRQFASLAVCMQLCKCAQRYI